MKGFSKGAYTLSFADGLIYIKIQSPYVNETTSCEYSWRRSFIVQKGISE
jgi:hypothetical protein